MKDIENLRLCCGAMASVTRGHEYRNYIDREINHIMVLFPEDKMSELYNLCINNGIDQVAEQYMFSGEALAIVINGYVNGLVAEKQVGKKKKPQQARVFSKSRLVTDIKQSRKANKIFIYFADGRFEALAREGKNYRLVKEKIIEFGRVIVETIEENILSDQTISKVNKLEPSERSNALIKKVKTEKKLLMEERQLYMKWKFYFEHQDEIEQMMQYKTSEDLKLLLRGRIPTFKQLNSDTYTFSNLEEDFDIARRMYEQIQANEESLVQTLIHIK